MMPFREVRHFWLRCCPVTFLCIGEAIFIWCVPEPCESVGIACQNKRVAKGYSRQSGKISTLLRTRYAELTSVYKGPIILRLASENMLDSLFEQHLQKGDLLPLGKEGKHLLVETSYFNPPYSLHNILLRIKSKGYAPRTGTPRTLRLSGAEGLQTAETAECRFSTQPALLGGSLRGSLRCGCQAQGQVAVGEHILSVQRDRHP